MPSPTDLALLGGRLDPELAQMLTGRHRNQVNGGAAISSAGDPEGAYAVEPNNRTFQGSRPGTEESARHQESADSLAAIRTQSQRTAAQHAGIAGIAVLDRGHGGSSGQQQSNQPFSAHAGNWRMVRHGEGMAQAYG